MTTFLYYNRMIASIARAGWAATLIKEVGLCHRQTGTDLVMHQTVSANINMSVSTNAKCNEYEQI